MDTINQLLGMAADCQRISAEHGFWDDKENRNKGEMVGLICSELYEAVEAHRKNKWANKERFLYYVNGDGDWYAIFKACIKDTIEDEIADAVIRILDYTHGWDIFVLLRDYRKESLGNFTHDVLRLNWYVLLAFEEKTAIYPGKDWGYVLAAIIKFCEWYNIDIVTHVRWKMEFNESRPHRHGKSY